jgi:hypothetical protein
MGQGTALQSVTDRLRKCLAYRSRGFGLHSKAATGTTSSCALGSEGIIAMSELTLAVTDINPVPENLGRSCSTRRRFGLRDSDLTCRDR